MHRNKAKTNYNYCGFIVDIILNYSVCLFILLIITSSFVLGILKLCNVTSHVTIFHVLGTRIS